MKREQVKHNNIQVNVRVGVRLANHKCKDVYNRGDLKLLKSSLTQHLNTCRTFLYHEPHYLVAESADDMVEGCAVIVPLQ